MAGEVHVASLDQIPPGEGRMVLVRGRTIALFHTYEGEVYATQAYCPHLKGPLADGLIGGTTRVCPLHDRTFDLTTGAGTSHECMSIETYPARVTAEGEIWLSTMVEPVAA